MAPAFIQKMLRHGQAQLDQAMYRGTGGRQTVAGLGTGLPVVLLHTVGAKTGRPHTVPLLVVPSQGGFIAVGSNFGRPKNPAWVHNVRAHPDVHASMRGFEAPVNVSELTGRARDSAFALATRRYPGWAQYVPMAAPRVIPVFVIRATGPGRRTGGMNPGGTSAGGTT